MKRLFLSLLAVLALAGPAAAQSTNVTATDFSTGIRAQVGDSVSHSLRTLFVNAAGTPLGTSSNPIRVDTTGTTTQPISAASLPLPALAATSTKQSDGSQKTQIVDGSGNIIASTSNNLNVQCANCSGSGVSAVDEASATEGTSVFAPAGGYFKTSITALTTGQQGMVALTASRSFHVSLYDAAGNALLGSKTSANSIPVVIASDQGAVAVSGTVTANLGTLNGVALDTSVNGLTVAQASTTSGQKGHMVQGAVTTNAPTYTTAQTDPLSLDTSGLLRVSLKDTPQNTTAFKVDGSAVTQPVSGTVAVSTAFLLDATFTGRTPAGASPADAESNTITTLSRIGAFHFVFNGTTWDRLKGAANALNSTGTGIPTAQIVGQFDDVSPTAITENQFGNLRMSTNRNLYGTIRDAAGNERGANVSAGNALLVDASATTQPISAASLPLPALAATSTKQSDGSQKTQIVDGSGNVIASTSNNLNVQCANCTGSGVSAVDNATVTESTSVFAPAGGEFQTTPGTVTAGHQSMVAITAKRAFQVSLFDAAGNALLGSKTSANSVPVVIASDQGAVAVSGTVTTTPPANASTNVAQINGTAITTGNGISGTGVQRVTLASDSTGQVTLAAGAASIGSLAANQSVNTSQINGVTPLMGNGVSGTGAQRFTLASDSTGQVALTASNAVSATLQSAAVANGNGTILNTSGMAVASLSVNCSSCSGGTVVNFEASEDGTNFTPVWATQSGTNTIATTTSTAGLTFWDIPLGVKQSIRARVSTYSAGTITVTGHATPTAVAAPVTNVNVIGSVSTTPPSNASTNIAQMNGVTTSMNTGVPDTGTQRVVVADGITECAIVSAASNNATNCKGSAGTFNGLELYNTTTTVYYLRLYNTATAPTCSSATGFIRSIPIAPASAAGLVGGLIIPNGPGVAYATGVSFCITGGSSSTDNTNAAVGIFGAVKYR